MSALQFRTPLQVPTPRQGFTVGLDDLIVTMGSCFADEIGHRLQQRFFNIEVNPAGTLFNPLSITAEICRAVDLTFFTPADVVAHPSGDRFVTMQRHSRFSSTDKTLFINLLNESLQRLHDSLRSCRLLVLTLGSARCFRLNATGEVVANCHKFPATDFSVEDLDVDATVDALAKAIEAVRQINPDVKVVLTVSPVRHIGYGLTADRLSKSTLIVAAHQLVNRHPDYIGYFPAYEALTDDLRDYRFYATDMVHPSETAIDYVMELWSAAYIEPKLAGRLTSWAKLYKNVSNRAVAPTTLLDYAKSLSASQETVSRVEALIKQLRNDDPKL